MDTGPAKGAAARDARSAMALRLLGAVALGFSALLHLCIALERPPLVSDGQVTLSGLFIAQAVAATLVVVWVLVRGDRPAWAAYGVVALGSLAALVLSVYVRLPSIGPFPVIYEPIWYLDKYLAAASAVVAVVVALVALVRPRRGARPGPPSGDTRR